MSTETLTFTGTTTGTTGFSIFVPFFFGMVRVPPLTEGQAGAVEPDRVVIFRGGSGNGEGLEVDPFAALMREVMAQSEAQQGRRGPPPASKASILAMKTVDEAEGDCPVCLESLRKVQSLEVEEEEAEVKEKEGEVKEEEGEVKGGSFQEEVVIKEMPCGHRYHGACIGKWLGMHGSCPTCRFRMPEEEGGGLKRVGEGGGEDAAAAADRRREVVVTLRLRSGEAQRQGSVEQVLLQPVQIKKLFLFFPRLQALLFLCFTSSIGSNICDSSGSCCCLKTVILLRVVVILHLILLRSGQAAFSRVVFTIFEPKVRFGPLDRSKVVMVSCKCLLCFLHHRLQIFPLCFDP